MTEPAPETVDTTAIAESVIYEMLGRRSSWPVRRAIEAYPIARDLILTGRPVKTIESIVDYNGNTVTDWELHSGFMVRLPQSLYVRMFPYVRPSDFEYYGHIIGVCKPREIVITYQYGSATPPPAVQHAINLYKDQLDLAIAGDSACQLPKRVTSISRQGMSMTILDPAEYLDKGLTGVPQIDSMIMFMNSSRAKRRARLFTDRNPPARRLLTEVVATT